MAEIEDDTIGGFNTFLEDQRDEPGEATVTLYDFHSSVDRIYRGRDIDEAPKLDDDSYAPGGKTALYDALATAIDGTDALLEEADETDQAENVIVVVLTDGKENASETPQDAIRERVEEHQDDDWEFLFIGANQDAALTATSMGMDADKSLDMDHSGDGTRAAYSSTSDRVSEVRQKGGTSGYTDADRRRQSGTDDR